MVPGPWSVGRQALLPLFHIHWPLTTVLEPFPGRMVFWTRERPGGPLDAGLIARRTCRSNPPCPVTRPSTPVSEAAGWDAEGYKGSLLEKSDPIARLVTLH